MPNFIIGLLYAPKDFTRLKNWIYVKSYKFLAPFTKMESSVQNHWQFLTTNTYFWLLIFYVKIWYFIKKRNVTEKNPNVKDEKQQNNVKKVYGNIQYHSLFWTHSTNQWCNMIQILERWRKYNWSEIFIINTIINTISLL